MQYSVKLLMLMLCKNKTTMSLLFCIGAKTLPCKIFFSQTFFKVLKNYI